tara:strand:+ start:322 stop:504 length:183 start_codon:yes stop_codon:yes gene_type:complete
MGILGPSERFMPKKERCFGGWWPIWPLWGKYVQIMNEVAVEEVLHVHRVILGEIVLFWIR